MSNKSQNKTRPDKTGPNKTNPDKELKNTTLNPFAGVIRQFAEQGHQRDPFGLEKNKNGPE